jgi:PPM family protein phosphatase
MNYSNLILDNISFKSYKLNNLKVTTGTILGNRNFNNDIIKIDNIEDSYIFLLADGHGGNYISKMVCNKILYNYYKKFKFKNFKSVKKLYKIIDKNLYTDYYCKNLRREGSTLTTIIIEKDNIIAINLGDSNYIIRYNKKYIYGDIHRLNNKQEINRVMNNKHKIIKIGKNFRIDGKLEISRSFGDFNYKLINNKYNGITSSVNCIPSHKVMENSFNYILISSDGLWDYVDKGVVLSIVDKIIDILVPSKIIEKLIKLAISKGSNDNISIILIKNCG